jgi:23S rRNA pseudouridine955/2504/2580 synthase
MYKLHKYMHKQPSRIGSSAEIINKMKDLSNVSAVEVDSGSEGQRVDNFLMRVCKGVPRSHIYRILRTGEVRINSRRVDATYRLQPGDRVRIPPMRVAVRAPKPAPAAAQRLPVVFEDGALLVVNKPSGLAVHGGSGVSFGVIEQMRAARPELKFLELVHRLDRETSGLLVLAKKRSALTALHAALREGRIRKQYLALVKGRWKGGTRRISLPLRKTVTQSGERRVSVHREGRESESVFGKEREFRDYTLLAAELLTGRTHQIRVQLTHLGFPIAGDDKYGDFELNRSLSKLGLKRMFLHAAELEFSHPLSGDKMRLRAPLPEPLARFLDSLAA